MRRESEQATPPAGEAEKRRVLILSADAGFGHKAAANAISEAFQMRHGDRCQVTVVNPLDHPKAPALLVSAQDDYDRMIQRSPDLYRVGYQASDGAVPAGIAEQALILMLFGVLRDILSEYDPHVVITTYPLYQAPLAALPGLWRRGVPFLTVVTDLATVHRLWFNENAEACFVPTPAVAEKALESGIAKDRIEITGLPVSPVFGQPVDKAALRAQLGWANDRFVALFAASKRVKKLEPIAQILNHSGLPVELALVTGGNEDLRARFEAYEWHLPARVYGFVDNMRDMMRAADFIVCKAGGLIVSESLAAGLPLLLAEALPGQEAGNAGHVVSGSAGALVHDPMEALVQVFHWLDHDGLELRATAERARRLGRPDAAARVADRALEVAIRGPKPASRGLVAQLPRLRELLGLQGEG